MNSPVISIEHHQIDMRYRHTRILGDAAIERIGRSISQFGQLQPISVIPDATGQYILIDGYLRVEACKRRGLDTVSAVCLCDEKQALIQVLTSDQQRPLQSIEQACLLDELASRFNLSPGGIARLVGRDKSWVHRRLSLIHSMSQSVRDALSTGVVSTWTATRILEPLARANTDHASVLIDYLTHHHQSSRQLNRFFDHYKSSSKPVRQNIIDQPELFFKSLEKKDRDRQTRSLIRGPEGRFIDDMTGIVSTLKRLTGHVPSFLSDDHKNRIKTQIVSATKWITLLQERIDHDRQSTETDYPDTAPETDRHSGHQSSIGNIPQHGEKSLGRQPPGDNQPII